MKQLKDEALRLAEIEYRLANLDDDSRINRFLASINMESDIEISYRKEPSFFNALSTRGTEHQVLICEVDHKISAIGVRSLTQNYINGKKEIIGYLSDLKVNSKNRKFKIFTEGYSFFKNLMLDNRTKLHTTTIIEDNKKAKAVLTWKNKSSILPNYYDFGRLTTYFILPFFKKNKKFLYSLRTGNIDNIDAIVEFLNKEGSKKQFYPVYTKDYFLNLCGFNLSDFLIAYKDNEIVGVMANWNQSDFKQVIMQKYNNKAKFLKYLPFLPKENQEIKFSYLSFFAVKDNNSKIFECLLTYIHKTTKKPLSICLHEKDNLNSVFTKYFKICYQSRLYIADYKSDEEIKNMVDDRIPYVELGVL